MGAAMPQATGAQLEHNNLHQLHISDTQQLAASWSYKGRVWYAAEDAGSLMLAP